MQRRHAGAGNPHTRELAPVALQRPGGGLAKTDQSFVRSDAAVQVDHRAQKAGQPAAFARE
jgi:hypothetical protein